MSRLVSADKQDFSVHFPSNLLSFPCNRKKYRSVYEFRRIRTHFPPSKRSAFSSRWNNSGYKWIVITLAEPHPPYLDLASDTNLTPVALTNSTCRIISFSHFSRTFALSFDIWFTCFSSDLMGYLKYEPIGIWKLQKGKEERFGFGDDRLATLLADSNRFDFYHKWQLFFSSKQTSRERFDITFIF